MASWKNKERVERDGMDNENMTDTISHCVKYLTGEGYVVMEADVECFKSHYQEFLECAPIVANDKDIFKEVMRVTLF